MYVSRELIYFIVQRKVTQHCKATVPNNVHVCLIASVLSDSFQHWTVICQTPLSFGSSRQEYWSGLPCQPPGDLLDPGIEPVSLGSSVSAGGFFTTSATWEAHTQQQK